MSILRNMGSRLWKVVQCLFLDEDKDILAVSTVNVGIIGCGRVAKHHVRSIRAHKDMNLAAICDLRDDRMEALPGAEEAARYKNYHEMLNRHPDIDVIAIITPSGMHYEHALDVIQHHGRSVVVEKPMVMRLSQGKLLEEAARKRGVNIFPVFQYRFNKCVQRIKRGILEKELGDIVLATVRTRWCRPQGYYDRDPWRGTYALDGGACTNQGIHHIDILRFFVGEVRRVNAVMKTFGAKIEVEDTVAATLEFESGALGIVEITTAARPKDYESSVSIVASNGLAMLGGWATDKLLTYTPNPDDEIEFSETFDDPYGFGHDEIYAGVYRKLTSNGRPAVEFEDGMRTLRLLHAIYVSNERGTWVNVGDACESSRLGLADETLAAQYKTASN